jgi:hypothetical protein
MTLRELALLLPNKPGQLAKIAGILARERINLAAISVDSTGTKGRVRIVVSDPDRAQRLLSQAGLPVEMHEMIAVRLEDRSGTFLKVLEVLSVGKINIRSVAILIAKEGSQSLVALSTDDQAAAKKVLQQAGFISQTAERLVSNADLIAAAPAIPSESVGLLL